MSKTKWTDLTWEQKVELYERYYLRGQDISMLADGLNMKHATLERYLRRVRSKVESSDLTGRFPIRRSEIPDDPTKFYQMLRRGACSLEELSKKFDRSKETILDAISDLERQGFVFEVIEEDRIKTTNRKKPRVDTRDFYPVLEDMDELVFGIVSDSHAGSKHSQPTAMNHFIEMAYHDFGVRHIFNPGDKTTGVNGYRGQEFDLLPSIMPNSRRDFANTMIDEVWLADHYTPRLPDLVYYELGGNHDYWGVMKASIDPIYRLAHMRDDIVYLGYDMADVPLTENLNLRLWHPRGGGGYNLTGKLQKGLDRVIRDEFHRAITHDVNPRSQILVAGHLHIEAKMQYDGVVAIHPGCFEGRTNFLKQLGLNPTIGGAIVKVLVDDNGFLRGVNYTFFPYEEIEDDWKNWDIPPQDNNFMGDVDELDNPIFVLKGRKAQ